MADVKIGDILEFAYWMTGEETESDLAEFTEASQTAMAMYMQEEHVLLSKGVAHIKRPGDERCPEVPDHIHGADVQLLVIEARVLMDLPGPTESRFADELEKDDFNRLAKITRDHYARRFGKLLTDGQVKTVINDIGPDAALDVLRGRVADTTRYIQ